VRTFILAGRARFLLIPRKLAEDAIDSDGSRGYDIRYYIYELLKVAINI